MKAITTHSSEPCAHRMKYQKSDHVGFCSRCEVPFDIGPEVGFGIYCVICSCCRISHMVEQKLYLRVTDYVAGRTNDGIAAAFFNACTTKNKRLREKFPVRRIKDK